MAIFATGGENTERSQAWLDSLPPDQLALVKQAENAINAKQNYESAIESGGRGTLAAAKKRYESMGGDAGYDAKIAQLQTNPQLFQSYSDMKSSMTSGGLGSQGDILASIAAVGGLGALYGGAAGGATAGGAGGATAAGGGLTAEAAAAPALSGAAGSGLGLSEATLGAGTAGALSQSGGDSGTATTAPASTSSTVSPNTLGSLIQGGTALWAGQQGVDAANKATDELRRQFDIGQTNSAPWLEAGKTALGAQQDLMGLGANGPEAQLSSLMNSPGYQFRLNTGRRNLEASSAARGGMGSGKAATAMNQYGQDYASNEYGNRLNQLAGVSGTGQTQANQNMNTGMNYAGEMGNASLAGAQARQSGILGAGSALSNWLNPPKKELTLADLLRSQ